MSAATDTEILRAMREFLLREFPKRAAEIARLSADDSLAELGVLDSLGVLTLAAFIEAKWNVKVPPKSFKASFRSLRELEATVVRLRAGR